MTENNISSNQDVSNAIQRLSDENFVVFAGTGCTSGTGIADWTNTLAALTEQAGIEFPAGLSEIDYPDIAQKCYENLAKEGREADYIATIREQLRTRTSYWSPLQDYILDATTRIVTTNYDETFEKIFKRKRITPNIQKLPDFPASVFATAEKSLIYLHGKLISSSQHDSIVFKADEYNYFYPVAARHYPNAKQTEKGESTCIEDFIKYIYKESTLVFVGFSFSDKYFLRTLTHIYDSLVREEKEHSCRFPERTPKLGTIKHYAFMDKPKSQGEPKSEYENNIENKAKQEKAKHEKDKSEQLKGKLKKISIEVLEYNEHQDCQGWFEEIAELKSQKEDSFAKKQDYIPLR